jgi:hypothetical protein
MSTAFSFIDIQVAPKSLPVTKGFRFTDRDLDILEFILEMKFSTLEDIHSKFFKVTKDGSISNSMIWARQRISKLIKSEYIQILTDVCARPLYVLTQKGFLFLKNSRLSKTFCRPLLDVDARFFDHDQRVAQARIALEKSGVVKHWISERQLIEFEEFKKYLSAEFRPDGIYETIDGKKVAFELEIARKSKDRYQQKVKRYISLMTECGHDPIFSQVHFVCEKENIRKLIQDYTELFQPCFKFNLISEIIK